MLSVTLGQVILEHDFFLLDIVQIHTCLHPPGHSEGSEEARFLANRADLQTASNHLICEGYEHFQNHLQSLLCVLYMSVSNSFACMRPCRQEMHRGFGSLQHSNLLG